MKIIKKEKAVSDMLAGVFLVIFVVAVGLLYQGFFKDYISSITESIDKGKYFHGYSVEQCAKFIPNMLAFTIRSNISYPEPLPVSSTSGKEYITYNGRAISKNAHLILSVWSLYNTTWESWMSLYDHYGTSIVKSKRLTPNGSFPAVYALGSDMFAVVEQYFNGTNFELNISLVNSEGNVIQSKRLTFDEENQRIPSVAFNGTHIAVVFVQGENATMDIKMMLLDTSLNIVDFEDITNTDGLQYNPAIAPYGKGFVIAYENYEYGNSTIEIGTYENGIFVLQGNVSSLKVGVYSPTIAVSPSYIFVGYTSMSGGKENVRYTLLDSLFGKIKEDVYVYPSPYNQIDPSAVYGNNKFVLSWIENGVLRGIRIEDLNFTITDMITLIVPQQVYAISSSFADEVFSLLTAGEYNSLIDLVVRFISDKKFVVIIQNPTELNITITDFRIFFNDYSWCLLRGDDYYLAPYSSEMFVAYDCDPSKMCEDVKEIRLGTECGVRTFKPEC